jgi:hypothetical protein
MNKKDLETLVKECISEVVAEGYDEFQRADKGSKGVAAKDKAEEDTYGAGYAAGEKAAKSRYKKLAEAYKQLKEDGFGLGPKGLDTNDDLDEANLGHNEISSIHREGRFWIATYKTVDGIQEKSFESEEDAKKFLNTLDEARFPKGADIGKPGKGFEKIAKAAEKRYGSKEAGQKVAGAILKKVLKK